MAALAKYSMAARTESRHKALMPNQPPHVALIVETSKVYGREILLGISRYMALHGPWSIFTQERGQE